VGRRLPAAPPAYQLVKAGDVDIVSKFLKPHKYLVGIGVMTKPNSTGSSYGMRAPLEAPPSCSLGLATRRGPLTRIFLLVVLLLVSAGCGGVDWFPEYKRLPTTPDPFTFPAKTGVPLSATVTSDEITVSGLTGDSSPISVIGSTGSGSKYSVNGAAATDASGTVTNGDKVTLSHTSSSALGTVTSSTVTIGNVSGTFFSTTQTVATPAFSAPVRVGLFLQSVATLNSVDGIVGTHVISIGDSLNNTAEYAMGDDNFNPGVFTKDQQTIPILNNRRIFVRNLPSATSVTTTLTIDGVPFTVNLSQP